MAQHGTASMMGNTDRVNACYCQLQISEFCVVSGMVLNRKFHKNVSEFMGLAQPLTIEWE
jgi:hypothetical protein